MLIPLFLLALAGIRVGVFFARKSYISLKDSLNKFTDQTLILGLCLFLINSLLVGISKLVWASVPADFTVSFCVPLISTYFSLLFKYQLKGNIGQRFFLFFSGFLAYWGLFIYFLSDYIHRQLIYTSMEILQYGAGYLIFMVFFFCASITGVILLISPNSKNFE